MKTPAWAKQICDRFGTIGKTPKYRVIWAPDRLEQCFGKTIRAYPQIGDRWILEALIPWEKFGPWNYEAFGPKPADGEYVHSHTMQYIEGEGKQRHTAFISLEDYGTETLRLLVTCVDRGKMISPYQMRLHREAMLEKQAADEHKKFSDEWDEIQNVGLVGGPLGENAVSGIPSKKTSADIKIVRLEDLDPEMQRKLRCRPGSVKQVS